MELNNDIAVNSGEFVNLAGAQTITGAKTFTNNVQVNYSATEGFVVISNGNNGLILSGSGLLPAKGNWNIKQGGDGTFLFDQTGGLSGRIDRTTANSFGGTRKCNWWHVEYRRAFQ